MKDSVLLLKAYARKTCKFLIGRSFSTEEEFDLQFEDVWMERFGWMEKL